MAKADPTYTTSVLKPATLDPETGEWSEFIHVRHVKHGIATKMVYKWKDRGNKRQNANARFSARRAAYNTWMKAEGKA